MFSFNLKKVSIEKILFLFLIILGVFYRLYNSNFEDYWLDELFGFWLSDPKLSFNETYERSLGPGWGQNMLFDFVLKYFEASFSTIPIPFGFGSALIDLFKLALKGLLRSDDILNDIVSPCRKDNLSV